MRTIAPPEETGSTFEENADLKAIYYSSLRDEMVLADDSGLQVDSLQGKPGIFSARYAGPEGTDQENNLLLLRNLAGVDDRTAHFVSVIAVARGGKVIAGARGTVEGVILKAPRGSGGFGYDPLFFYPPFGRTFGEASDEEKLSVSARGKALRAVFEQLRNLA